MRNKRKNSCDRDILRVIQMPYEAKNYDHLIGIKGLSDTLMKNHFTLYQGYVTNANKLLDLMKGKEGPEFAELKRRFGWEFNGMRMHEIFFRILSKTPSPADKKGKLFKKIEQDFGSFENWQKDFVATATMRGMGWTVLYYDIFANRLLNCWVNEHDVGHLATCAPILVIDVFEHAFMIDYGLKRADYVQTILNNLEWKEIEKLYALVGGK